MYFKLKPRLPKYKRETEGLDWLLVVSAILFGMALGAPIFLALVAECK